MDSSNGSETILTPVHDKLSVFPSHLHCSKQVESVAIELTTEVVTKNTTRTKFISDEYSLGLQQITKQLFE